MPEKTNFSRKDRKRKTSRARVSVCARVGWVAGEGRGGRESKRKKTENGRYANGRFMFLRGAESDCGRIVNTYPDAYVYSDF